MLIFANVNDAIATEAKAIILSFINSLSFQFQFILDSQQRYCTDVHSDRVSIACFIVNANHSIMLVGGFGPQGGIALPYACDTVPLHSIPTGVFAMLDLCQAHRISRSSAGDL
jgi:hypothetical protein